MGRRIVVVGASAAGLTAADTLRREGHDGPIIVVGDETCPPYDRPPLSKQILAGTWQPEKITLRDEAALRRSEITLRLGTTATGLDTGARTVKLRDGETLGYDGLIIATGVAPRRLPIGVGMAGVHVMRTLDDALRLRDAITESTRLVVIGAGFLGAEVAASARTRGADVTVVDPLPVPMLRQFGERIGQRVAQMHRAHGVGLRLNTAVTGLRGDDAVTGVELDDGSVLDADVVLIAVGSTPNTGWLADSGLHVDDGVVCDSMCQASPDVYAAGDVARWFNPRFGLSMRVEHRMNATEQGMAAARNLLGQEKAFDPIPYFWTDQFDVKIQAYGHFPTDSEVAIVHGDLAEDKFVARYLTDGVITGVLGWNMPKQVRLERACVGDKP
ncbi:NAD(P)/FAD-dependent oxidoreductase [Stackebrandtia nassauensis]|uniref:FAD-dependent pyridine nucleotide-disulfide oxidoreductase n=1 Tax=Stackebrandtia nassauensis (strain DSM 44728 / CIP 108903 / NRRL B-16338 / NBRC 102104 / LLR-40K-21) TaxID=446470 RepID=D3Q7E3_STANL|nr:FAD/NAD(P)-binding oxidoreductase [Stackebrandtia nassauensis]ADD42414.1 FAD-dependent pyridine nucleotide-disulfide oxidoreductase [Stackebrandtia nassauensis DSM 44728]